MIVRSAQRYGPVLATVLVALVLYVAAGLRFEGFFSLRVAAGFFADNAVLAIAAIGMTFVIVSGGIDLSVGAVVGCSSILIATLVEEAHWHPLAAISVALLLGAAFGAAMGGLIHAFELPPFIVTLGGMFFARGLGFVIHQEAIAIRHPFYETLHAAPSLLVRSAGLPPSAARLVELVAPATTIILLVTLAAALYIAHATRAGRNVYAVGGSEESARLMGLPIGRTRIMVYAFSGLCSALAGAVYSLYTFSGNAAAGTMLELDAIAAAVIGGALLSGGSGYVIGTMFGVLIFGIVQTAIIFEGSLSSWWTRIAIGGLLLGFIGVQQLIAALLARAGRHG